MRGRARGLRLHIPPGHCSQWVLTMVTEAHKATNREDAPGGHHIPPTGDGREVGEALPVDLAHKGLEDLVAKKPKRAVP